MLLTLNPAEVSGLLRVFSSLCVLSAFGQCLLAIECVFGLCHAQRTDGRRTSDDVDMGEKYLNSFDSRRFLLALLKFVIISLALDGIINELRVCLSHNYER